MDVGKLKDDVGEGKIGVGALVDLVVKLCGELNDAKRRIAELERQLEGQSAAAKVDQPYSLEAEERRQEARGKKRRARKATGRRGRITTAEKVARATRVEKCFPAGVDPEVCWLSHTRPIWRLEQGQAVLVAYEIYRGPKNQFGQVAGALGRGEFGLEVILAIAYQVFIIGLSFDKVALLMNFFQNLRLRKSQIDSLMKQLSRSWEGEFDVLCVLLANSAVVHADETSWSIHSVWALLSEKVRLLFFGVHKDAVTLQQILDPAVFQGIVISDDAAVYANFSQSQKCWAHLLRKAIKLTLLAPDNAEYRDFADRLLEIYRTACRIQADRRLSDAGRTAKVAKLDDEILKLCGAVWMAELPTLEGPADDYRLLCNELMRLMLARQLFTFVTAAAVTAPNGRTSPVGGTNNEAERTLRQAAEARKTGRTSKTPAGARRRTVIVSVLESLRQHLASFTLPTILAEILGWAAAGRSCFTKLAEDLDLPPSPKTRLNLIHLPAT